METLKVRVYDGRKLLYDKNGKVENKSQSIKMPIYHYLNKFLKYFNTLGPCLVVIEEVYNTKPIKNGQSSLVQVPPERFAELQALLDEKQSPEKKDIVVDPLKVENDDLKDRNDELADRVERLEQLMKDQSPPEPKKRRVVKKPDEKKLPDKKDEK